LSIDFQKLIELPPLFPFTHWLVSPVVVSILRMSFSVTAVSWDKTKCSPLNNWYRPVLTHGTDAGGGGGVCGLLVCALPIASVQFVIQILKRLDVFEALYLSVFCGRIRRFAGGHRISGANPVSERETEPGPALSR
jgi:hypothetical protein